MEFSTAEARAIDSSTLELVNDGVEIGDSLTPAAAAKAEARLIPQFHADVECKLVDVCPA
jgi:hypothetical protein